MGRHDSDAGAGSLLAGIAMAMGDIRPPRARIGRILGPLIKSKAVGNDEPMRRNSPTSKELLNTGEGDFTTERKRLCDNIDRSSQPDRRAAPPTRTHSSET
jgi:hypothetical protein